MNQTIEPRELPEEFTAVVYGSGGRDTLVAWLPDALATARAYLERWGAGPKGKPYVRFVGDEVEAGYAATTPVGGEGDVEPSDLPPGTAAVTTVGATDDVDAAITALETWIVAGGGTPDGAPWEVLVDEDPAGIREVVLPYRPSP